MDQKLESQIKAALKQGKEDLKTDTRAVSARYDPATGKVTMELVNGCFYIFPTHLVEDLANAPPEMLDEVIVDSVGYNLHFPRIDADVYVPALVSGVFGTKRWMEKALARRAGQAKSPAKAAASRANGKMGGRPRKVA